MANEMPSSDAFSGLSRKVIQYSEGFTSVIQQLKRPGFTQAAWAPLERLVDVDHYVRQGVFLGPVAETIDWPTYKSYITSYGGATDWEGTLRHITEGESRVILELEERNTRDGFTHISNTATIYGFDQDGRLRTLDVYVMSLNAPLGGQA